MPEVIVKDAKAMNADQNRTRNPYKKGQIIRLPKTTVQRLLKAGVIDLTPEEKKQLAAKNAKKQKRMTISSFSVCLHPAGGTRKGDALVYEPIGHGFYAWKKGEKRGVSATKFDPDAKEFLIEITKKHYAFDGKPLFRPVFKVPKKEAVDEWVEGKLKVKTGQEIYEALKKYLQVCLDLPQDYSYHLGCIAALQTWIIDYLNAVIFFSVEGKYGSGKTVFNETLMPVCRHGVMASSISPSAIPRICEQQKLALLHDEIDVKTGEKDSEIYQYTRQAYRRNNKYIRWDKDKGQPDVSEAFAVNIFSLHGSMEKALSTRALKIPIGETDDSRLPIVNLYKEVLGEPLMEDLFFWYMDNILTGITRLTHLTDLTGLSLYENTDFNDIRQKIYAAATKEMDQDALDFLNALRGRNVELAYIALFVCDAFGLDVFNDLKKAFESKQLDEAEFGVNTYTNLLKEILAEQYEEVKNNEAHMEEGVPWVVLSDIYKTLNEQLTEKGLTRVSYNKFAGYLQDFDFIEGVNKKRKKVKRKERNKEVIKFIYCLFFDSRVLKNIIFQTPDTPDKSVKPVRSVKCVKGKAEERSERAKKRKERRAEAHRPRITKKQGVSA